MILPGYSIREMEDKIFEPLFRANAKKYFENETQVIPASEIISETEKISLKKLRETNKQIKELRLGVFFQEKFIGWNYSRQEPFDSLYMQNTAIFPEHRRKGLYAELIKVVIDFGKKEGFQKIWSRHRTTNNAVIIPKLKAGFLISGIEVSDQFGTLVQLSYFFNPTRNKIMNYRTGHIKPDDEIIKLIR